MAFSKFFTPAFSQADRRALVSALGFNRQPYSYLDTLGETVLAHSRFVGAHEESYLSDVTVAGDPKITRFRQTTDLVGAGETSPTSLWEEVFPEPLRSLAPLFKGEASDLRLTPPAFRDELVSLWKAISLLESKAGDTELFCFMVRGDEGAVPVLIHSVRRKRIRVGTASYLLALETNFLNHSLSAATLKQFFGTSAGFLYVDTRRLAAGPAILAQALDSGLSGRAPGLIAAAHDTPFPEIEL